METQGPKGKGEREGSAGGRGQSGWEAGESRRRGVGEACLPLSGATGKLSDVPLETSIPGRLLQKEAGLRPRHLPLPSRCPESPVVPGRVAAPQPEEGPGEVKAEPGVPAAWAELAASDPAGSHAAP